AAIAIPVFLGIAFLGSGPFAVAVFVLAALGLCELLRAYRAAGIGVNSSAALIGLVGPAVVCMSSAAGFESESGPHWMSNLLDAASRYWPYALCIWLLAAMSWEVVRSARTGETKAGRNLG